MNKTEFLKELDKKLKYLPKADREDAVSYYSEYLADMGADETEDVVCKIGKPKDIATSIITECAEKKIEENKEGHKVKRSTQIIWMLIILIFSLPVTIPIAFVLFSVLLGVLCLGLSFVFAAFISFVSVFVVTGIGQKIVCFGMTLILLALAVLIILGVVLLGELFVKLIIGLVKKLSNKEK